MDTVLKTTLLPDKEGCAAVPETSDSDGGGLLATFFLITYNQERYIREALEGAFAQTYSPLEIVVSDDCSTDGTFRIIEEMCGAYHGPHTVVVNRNPENLGLIGHINRITTLSSGELIIYAAGDDISLPWRTSKVVERYLATGRNASSIHSPVIPIDRHGNRSEAMLPPLVACRMDLQDMALSGALIIGAANAFSRKTWELFGPIRNRHCIEDLVIGFRSAVTGGLEYIDDPLVLYRHDSGMTSAADLSVQTCEESVRRELRFQEIYMAVLAQRIDDLKRIGRHDFIPLMEKTRLREMVKHKVWSGDYSFFRIMIFSFKKGLPGLFIKSFIRVRKWRLLYPVRQRAHRRG